jgi:hypothetical protein
MKELNSKQTENIQESIMNNPERPARPAGNFHIFLMTNAR